MSFKDAVVRGIGIYIAFGVGVVFGAFIATVTTLAVVGIPEAESIMNVMICSE